MCVCVCVCRVNPSRRNSLGLLPLSGAYMGNTWSASKRYAYSIWMKGALQLSIERSGSIRFAQVPERVSTQTFVVLILGNSESNHLGAQGTFHPTTTLLRSAPCSHYTVHTLLFTPCYSQARRTLARPRLRRTSTLPRTLTSARPPTRAWVVVRTVVAPPLSVVECGMGGFVRVVVCLCCCSCCVVVCVTCFSCYTKLFTPCCSHLAIHRQLQQHMSVPVVHGCSVHTTSFTSCYSQAAAGAYVGARRARLFCARHARGAG